MIAIFAVLAIFFAAPMKLGSDTYGKTTLETLEILGTIKLHETTVLKESKVTGNLIANGAHFSSVDVTGDAQFTNTVIDKTTHIIGSLKAINTQFHQPINFLGQKAVFSHCNLPGLTIERDASFKAKQIVELKENTRVDGPITFEGGKGEIHLYFGSKIHGTVTGGKVVQKI